MVSFGIVFTFEIWRGPFYTFLIEAQSSQVIHNYLGNIFSLPWSTENLPKIVLNNLNKFISSIIDLHCSFIREASVHFEKVKFLHLSNAGIMHKLFT